MANLHDIKRRIQSVKSTQKITRAMKMVAAAKLRRAQESIQQARPYALRMRDLVNNMASRAELDGHPLLTHTEGGAVTLIVVTSDRGLCGAFNSNIVNAARDHIETTFAGRTVNLTAIGKRGVDLLHRRYGEVAHTHEGLLDGSLFEGARVVVDQAAEPFIEGRTGEVYCLYNRFRSAVSQEVTLERLLPFEADIPEDGKAIDYVYEPSAADLFESLLLRHLNVQMHRVLNESAASEHGARMTAMDAATNNAGEMIDQLTLQYNRARQDAITTELIEVVSGAEAL